jgi:hypothetical protein
MDLKEMRWSGLDWIDLAQEHGNEPSGAVKCWRILE